MAATASREIQVHVLFPRIVTPGVDLDLNPTNWRWVHCLTFPLETLNALQFSPRPYKWIRYAVGVVVGAEGHLSTSRDSLNIVDYNVPAKSAVLYYHTSNEERQRMVPIDPKIGRTAVTSSVPTTRRVDFRNEVAERDGRECILSGESEMYCDAVHLLAHSKGDEYIATYTRHRSQGPEAGDIIQEIDNVQNGLFLNNITHRALGKDVAFLTTPNFAMDTNDIDPAALPAEKRCTAHLFQPDTPYALGTRGREVVPSGSPLRISDNSKWPPAILFDAVYADAVLHHFGTQAVDEFSATWRDTFYPGGVVTAAHAGYGATLQERAAASEKKQKQAEDRQARYEARKGPDIFDKLMILPYIAVPQEERKAMFREAEEKAKATEQRRVQEKVDTWIKQLAPNTITPEEV